ncbi:uncharacterized protein LOC106053327 [Biomphalaria glabrata]|uniref:Uncharacterized protein LOC106053327 n=1 Tax=Biomphalaria glabrata TaxID=6526 RepID=A0A9U8DWV7_BIOGL|nr:uncharacterized protein LOC106053327 [Biomphalaria glabrata]
MGFKNIHNFIGIFLLIHWTTGQREYDMDELATCGRTINVDDSGVRLNGRGNTAPSNPPLECIVYLMSVYARDDGSNKLQIEVESLTIKDCTVRLDLFNGRTSVGTTLRALSCQYAPTDIIYSTGREVTVRFSRPDRLVHNEYQYSILIKPFKDQNVPGTIMGVDALPVGAIIGIVIGCVILVALIILFLWCCCTGRLGNFNVPGQSIFKTPPPKKVIVESSAATEKSKPQIINYQDPVVWNTVTTGKFDPQASTRSGMYQKGAPRIGRRFDNDNENYRNVPNQRDSMRSTRHDYEQYGFEQRQKEEEAKRQAEIKKNEEEVRKRLEEKRKAEERKRQEEAARKADTSKETLIDDVFESDSANSEKTDDSVVKKSPRSSPKQKRKNVPETEDMDKGKMQRYLSIDLQSQPESDTISSPLHVNAGVRSKIDNNNESPNASLRKKKSPLLKHKGKEPDPTALPPEAFEPIFTSALTGINYPGNQPQQPFGYPGGFYPYGFIPAGAFAPGPPGTQTYAYAYQTVPQGGAAPQGGAYIVQDTPTQAGGNMRKAFAVEMSPNKRTPDSARRKHDDPFNKKGKGQIRNFIPNEDLSLIARGAAPPDPGQGQRSVALKSGTDPKSGIHTTQVVWTDTVPHATDPKPGENPQITRKTITKVTTKSGFAELPPETNILMMEDSEPAFLDPGPSSTVSARPAIAYTPQNENLAFYTGEGSHPSVEPPARSSTPTSMHRAPVYNYAIRDRILVDDSTV